MKVNPSEIEQIKFRMPFISTVLNEDFFHLKEIQNSIEIKIYAVTLWERWLTREEFDEFFYCSIEEEKLRRKKFVNFYKLLMENYETAYTWKYIKKRQRNEIRKLTSYKKRQQLKSIKNYNIDYVKGIFELILPEHSVILEMGCDWTCTLITFGNKENLDIFEIIEEVGLKYFINN